MKLLRWGSAGAERPGLLDRDGVLRDLTGHVSDIAGPVLSPAGLDRLRALDPSTLPPVPGTPRLGPPVAGTGKFIAIGLNYADHAAETGATVPPEPVVFLKAVSCIVGPDDPVEIPRGSVKTDWEVELGVVIGSRAKYVPLESALDHVAGYCVVNDVSERDFQMNRSGTWDKGKGHDGFGPVGPWLVTQDEVADPQNLRLWLEVDGRRFQDGSTATMVYGVAFLVHYLSRFMTLHPGDLICTGTPPGVGLGQKPPVFLTPGQTIRLGVEGLGVQTQRTVAA